MRAKLLTILPMLAIFLSGCVVNNDNSTTTASTNSSTSSSSTETDLVEPSPDSSIRNLNGGFSIMPKGADPTTHVVTSIMEASKAISMATLKHYSSTNITFNFNNVESANNFISNYLELDTAYTISTSNYATGTNKTNSFSINYTYSNAASYRTTQTSAKSFPDIENLAQIVRWSNQNHRDSDYNNFPIDVSNKGTLEIYNSEELWWAVSNNYLPTFPLVNSRVEKIYQMAKNVCRYYVNDDMNNLEKMRAIYEWIVSQNRYDYNSNDDNSVDFQTNVCYYLEGIFEYGSAVCDSFSKTYALLCGIENLPVVRAYGYDTDGGHAWNYGSPDGSTYYLICTTWGQLDKTVNNVNYGMCDYKAFLTKKTYFSDNSTYNFAEYIYPNLTKSANLYLPSVFTLDVLKGTSYDYKIDSQNELNAILKTAKDVGINHKFSLQVIAGDVTPTTSMLTSALSSAGMSYNTVTLFSDESYYNSYTFLIR